MTNRFSPPSDFNQHQKEFFNIFGRSDLMNFASFHNHEQSGQHSDMISYVMNKFIDHYAYFLKGNRKSKISDLR